MQTKYKDLKLTPADNGFKVTCSKYVKHPTTEKNTYGDGFTHEGRVELVFEKFEDATAAFKEKYDGMQEPVSSEYY